MVTTDPAPLRVDAQARRARLVDAATRLFADEGLDVPMERIAREAGVGVGTLYRRFPDRTTLLVAVAAEGLRRLRDRLRDGLQAHESAWDAFTEAFDRPQRAMALRGRLAQAPDVAAAVDADPRVLDLQREVVAALAAVVAAAQAEGAMRTDVGPGDVALLLSVAARRTVPVGAPPEAAARLRALLLDTLAAGPRAQLPGDPLSPTDIWPHDPSTPGTRRPHG